MASAVIMIMALGVVVLILLMIHFFSTYFKGSKQDHRFDSDLQSLRREARDSYGVSQHNLFYYFFFRDK